MQYYCWLAGACCCLAQANLPERLQNSAFPMVWFESGVFGASDYDNAGFVPSCRGICSLPLAFALCFTRSASLFVSLCFLLRFASLLRSDSLLRLLRLSSLMCFAPLSFALHFLLSCCTHSRKILTQYASPRPSILSILL